MNKTTRWALMFSIAVLLVALVWDFTPRASMKDKRQKEAPKAPPGSCADLDLS